jgi:GNAT superfamily N-acetyltransferase
MADEVKIVTVSAENLDQEGFFCYNSKRKALGYHRKQEWLRQRFAEGMGIRILYEGARSVAFIEYTPGEYAWRPANAAGYMFIHCLWTVGRAKRKGYATRLLTGCIEDAREQGMRGVATVTSTRSWLTGPKWFLDQGFESADKAPPTFDLLANRFDDGPSPSFPHNWEERCKGFGDGLTVVRADQCPYIDAATKAVVEAGNDVAVPVKVVELTSAAQVQQLAPSAYGVFGIVYNGELLSYYLPRDLRSRLAQSQG